MGDFIRWTGVRRVIGAFARGMLGIERFGVTLTMEGDLGTGILRA